MKQTLINTPSLASGKIAAKKLVQDFRMTDSYSELFHPDLFEVHRPYIFIMHKAPTAEELKEIQQIGERRVIFVAEKLPATNPFVTWIKKKGEYIDLTTEAPWQKQKRLENHIKSITKSIDQAALKLLLELPEEQIESEVEKLSTYNPHIALEAVEQLVAKSVTSSVWTFLDALLERDPKKALACPLDESLFGLMKLVRNQYKNLLLLKTGGRAAVPQLKERAYNKLSAAHYTTAECEKILVQLDQLDFMMRDGLTDPSLISTLMVSYTC